MKDKDYGESKSAWHDAYFMGFEKGEGQYKPKTELDKKIFELSVWTILGGGWSMLHILVVSALVWWVVIYRFQLPQSIQVFIRIGKFTVSFKLVGES